jgi:hypothetical protein
MNKIILKFQKKEMKNRFQKAASSIKELTASISDI